jgi:hypothetical protein
MAGVKVMALVGGTCGDGVTTIVVGVFSTGWGLLVCEASTAVAGASVVVVRAAACEGVGTGAVRLALPKTSRAPATSAENSESSTDPRA